MTTTPPNGPGQTPETRRRSSTRAVTLQDVALLAGVSSQTVSRALRDPVEVAEHTLERVEAAVQQTGYVPNLAARNLASNKSKLVATIVPSISTSVFSDTLAGASAILSPHGYQLLLGYTNYDEGQEERLLRNLLGRRPDGIFLIGVLHTPESIAMLRAAGIPVVETWGWLENPIDDLVGFSNHDAMRDLTHELYSYGYRRFTFVGSQNPGDQRARERVRGFVTKHAELFPSRAPRFLDSSEYPLTLDAGATFLHRAREQYPDTDVIMFATDILANGAVLEANARGISVPGDVAITGFGDFDLSAAITPGLTTVSIPIEKMGRMAAEMLLQKMEDVTLAPRVINLGFSITRRASA